MDCLWSSCSFELVDFNFYIYIHVNIILYVVCIPFYLIVVDLIICQSYPISQFFLEMLDFGALYSILNCTLVLVSIKFIFRSYYIISSYKNLYNIFFKFKKLKFEFNISQTIGDIIDCCA